MSIEYDMSKFPHSRGVQCGVLLDRIVCRVRTAHQPSKAPAARQVCSTPDRSELKPQRGDRFRNIRNH